MRHNILIVDDEQLIRQGLRARIEYLGIDVDEIFEAENGLMALRLQEEHPIDVVITDIRMPDMDGLELIQEMQKKICRTQRLCGVQLCGDGNPAGRKGVSVETGLQR